VTAVAGGAPSFCDTRNGAQRLKLSSDGILVGEGTGVVLPETLQMYIYRNNQLSGALAKAIPVIWLDNGSLLVNTYVDTGDRYPQAAYAGAIIVDPSGNVLGRPPVLPEILTAQLIAPNTLYAPLISQIFSLPDGTRIWSTANANSAGGLGTATATQAIFTSGNFVLTQAH
jgi:hypothetical protein